VYYNQWGGRGSYTKLQKWLWEEKGENASRHTVMNAVTRYLMGSFKDPEVKKAVQRQWVSYGKWLSDEDYYRYVSKRVMNLVKPTSPRYDKFLEDNPEVPDFRNE